MQCGELIQLDREGRWRCLCCGRLKGPGPERKARLRVYDEAGDVDWPRLMELADAREVRG